MPKSKEFIESSDSDNDGESGGATSKQSKAKGSSSKNDVNSFKTKMNLFFCLNQPPAKRPKTSDSTDGTTASKAGPNGDRLYEVNHFV